MNAYRIHAEASSGVRPGEKSENTAFSPDAEQVCCIGFPGGGVASEIVKEANGTETEGTAETTGENEENNLPDTVRTDSGPDFPVSISMEHYREEGIAHFFSNENRTYHPFGSERASGDTGVSLIAGVGHPKTAARPSAAFRDTRAKKKGDSNLVGLDLGLKSTARKAWLPKKPGAHPIRPMRPATGPGKAIPLPVELFGGIPKQDDRLLASAFAESAPGAIRKEREPIRSAVPSKRLKARPTGAPVHSAVPVLPIPRLPDGEIDLSDPPAARLKESDFSRMDPNLRCLVDAWPTLPSQVRDTIMHAARNG